MKKRFNKKGFTLVELIVVIVIVLILAAVLVPTLMKYISSARKATCTENKHSMATKLMAECIVNDAVPDEGAEVTIPDELKSFKCPSGGEYTAKYENGVITVTCSVHDEGETAGDKSGYQPAKVADSAKEYEKAVNAVLKTLYDSVVAERLGNDTQHISYVQFNNGQVDKIKYYSDANDRKGNHELSVTAQELNELNQKISTALEETEYKLANSDTTRVFFDWNGNAISGCYESGNKIGIGGQGANATLKFNDKQTLNFSNDKEGWRK